MADEPRRLELCSTKTTKGHYRFVARLLFPEQLFVILLSMLRIGSHEIDPPYILAPMAGVSQMPFRVLARSFGAGLAPTELISAKGLLHRNQRTLHYLIHDVARETPHCVQLFGGDLEPMTQAARACVDEGANIIDINMGCPVRKVTKTGAGSALLCDVARAAEVLGAIRRAVPQSVAVTAKLRAGWDADHINCVEMAQALQQAGCQAVALHARTRAQGYSGTANWDLIGQVKQAVRIPVIGNGDVVTVADAHAMRARTGCDAVMIGRGALGNPWIFQQLKQGETDSGDGRPAGPQRLPVVLGHLRKHVALHRLVHQRQADPRTTEEQMLTRAVRAFRTHLVWYSTGLRGAALFRQRVMQLENLQEINQAVRAFFTFGSDSSSVELKPEDASVEAIDYRQAFG